MSCTSIKSTQIKMTGIYLSAFKIIGLEETLETAGTTFIPNNDLII